MPRTLYVFSPQTQKHPEYTGPRLGPKMAEENKREFTEEQLRASEGHLNLQMGYNKGASQAGVGAFGNTRHM
jgi:Calponin